MPNTQEHNWPPELEKGAKCYNCHLDYAEWSDPETLYCDAPQVW